VVAAYRSQSDAEFGFRQLKDPHAVSFSPMNHFTDQAIRVHTYTCVLALQLAHLMRRQADQASLHLSVRALVGALAGIGETVMIYPSAGGRPKARRMRDAVAISCRSAGGSSRDGSGWVGRWRWRAPPGADGCARACASDSGRAGESVSALARELGILRETSYTYIRRHPVEDMAPLRRCGGPTAAGPVHLGRPCSPGQNPNDLGLHGHVEGGGGSSPRSSRGCGRTSGPPPMGCNRVRRRARPCLRSVLRPVPACASRPQRR
jgi:hypothetical protein